MKAIRSLQNRFSDAINVAPLIKVCGVLQDLKLEFIAELDPR